MKRGPIINIIIGLLWIGLGIMATMQQMNLALFGIIPIPNVLVIIIGVVWTVLGIVALVRPHQAPVAPAAPAQQYPAMPQPQQYPMAPQPRQYDPQMPQYAPRDPQGPTPI